MTITSILDDCEVLWRVWFLKSPPGQPWKPIDQENLFVMNGIESSVCRYPDAWDLMERAESIVRRRSTEPLANWRLHGLPADLDPNAIETPPQRSETAP